MVNVDHLLVGVLAPNTETVCPVAWPLQAQVKFQAFLTHDELHQALPRQFSGSVNPSLDPFWVNGSLGSSLNLCGPCYGFLGIPGLIRLKCKSGNKRPFCNQLETRAPQAKPTLEATRPRYFEQLNFETPHPKPSESSSVSTGAEGLVIASGLHIRGAETGSCHPQKGRGRSAPPRPSRSPSLPLAAA